MITRLRERLSAALEADSPYFWLLVLACLHMFSWLTVFGSLIIKMNPTHDLRTIYFFYKSNIDAIERFGEVAWWSPEMGVSGFPLYYFSVLGDQFSGPVFVTIGLLVRLTKMLGLVLTDAGYFLLYLFHVGYIVPLLVSCGLLLTGRHFIKSRKALLYLVVISAFSPGVVFSVTDRGLESVIFSLFFAAAWLGFLKRPDRARFFGVGLTLILLAASFAHLSLYWNALFVPLFIIVTLLLPRDGDAGIKALLSAVPRAYWAGLVVAVFICLMPALLTVSHGRDWIMNEHSTETPADANILTETQGRRIYPFAWLNAGNPLEPLAVATPAVGFTWMGVDDKEDSPFMDFWLDGHNDDFRHLLYVYLGTLALPLMAIGLLYGQRVWRLRLVVLIAVFMGVVALNASSPFFALVLAWPSPLRSVRHFADTTFNIGTIHLLILASAMGMDLIARRGMRRFWRWPFLITLGASLVFSAALYKYLWAGKDVAAINDARVAFYYFLLAIFALALTRLFQAGNRRAFEAALAALLMIIAFDVATQSYMFVKKSKYIQTSQPLIDRSGQDKTWLMKGYSESLLSVKGGLRFPVRRLVRAVSVAEYEVKRDQAFVITSDPDPNARIAYASYNTVLIDARVPERSVLMLGEVHYPFWSATVNGARAEIIPLMGGAAKAVVIPSGSSEVRFTFSPGALPYLMALSYIVVALAAALWVRAMRLGPALL